MSEIAFVNELSSISKLLKANINFEPQTLLSELKNLAIALIVELVKALESKGIYINNIDVSGYANISISLRQGDTPIVKISVSYPGVASVWVNDILAKDVQNIIANVLQKYCQRVVKESNMKSSVEGKNE